MHLEDIRACAAQRLPRLPARRGPGVPSRPPRLGQPDHAVAERQRHQRIPANLPAGGLACIQAGAPAAIAAYQTRLTSILRQLRAAGPDAEIIVVGAYDPNIGGFAFAAPLFTQLNQAQQTAAATVRARFADPFPIFNPPGDPAAETAAICALTLLCTEGDGHPSDAGYRARRLSRIGIREPPAIMLPGWRADLAHLLRVPISARDLTNRTESAIWSVSRRSASLRTSQFVTAGDGQGA